jgi:ER lumen protein retaining receptor
MEKLKEMTRDTRILYFELKKRRKDIIFWFSIIITILFIYIFMSSKDFSFFLVLSSLVQTCAFVIILLKVTDRQNTGGLSANTLICYCILLFARLTSTLIYPGYLPNDSTGSWLYQLSDTISMLICCLLIYLIYFKYKETSDLMLDNRIPFYYLVIPSYILGSIVKSNLNNNFFCDTNWAFSMYLETVAIFPQILLFSIKKGQIEKFTSHYVALCGLSRLFSLIFWWDTYEELKVTDSTFGNYAGYFIIGAQILQLLIMADYYYLYFKSILKGNEINMDI